MWVCQGCQLSVLLLNIAADVLVNFINVGKRIKEIQIGDHGIEIANCVDGITIFSRAITCANRIQMVLKLNENAKIKSSSNVIFSKSQIFMGWCILK